MTKDGPASNQRENSVLESQLEAEEIKLLLERVKKGGTGGRVECERRAQLTILKRGGGRFPSCAPVNLSKSELSSSVHNFQEKKSHFFSSLTKLSVSCFNYML